MKTSMDRCHLLIKSDVEGVEQVNVDSESPKTEETGVSRMEIMLVSGERGVS